MDLENIKQKIQDIEARNKRVEADKAWETSLLRRGIIAIMTYFVVVAFMLVARVEDAWLNALVPCGAYLFSTWSLPFVKIWWVKRNFIREKD